CRWSPTATRCCRRSCPTPRSGSTSSSGAAAWWPRCRRSGRWRTSTAGRRTRCSPVTTPPRSAGSRWPCRPAGRWHRPPRCSGSSIRRSWTRSWAGWPRAPPRRAEVRRTDRGQPPPAPPPLPVPVPDSHTHLDHIGGDPDAHLRAAGAVGVDRVVQVGVDVASSTWAVELAARRPAVVATLAIHPNNAPRQPDLDEALRAIDRLPAHPRVRGIGETGLDTYRTGPDGRAAQEASFRAHIAIAKRYAKPLVIHDRDAHADVLRVLDEEG